MLDNELPSTSNGVGTQINDLSAYPLAKLIKGVEKSYDKGKNLLEESENIRTVFASNAFTAIHVLFAYGIQATRNKSSKLLIVLGYFFALFHI